MQGAGASRVKGNAEPKAQKHSSGGLQYEAQNVLYPIPACGRRVAAAARGKATALDGDEWREEVSSARLRSARRGRGDLASRIEPKLTERDAA